MFLLSLSFTHHAYENQSVKFELLALALVFPEQPLWVSPATSDVLEFQVLVTRNRKMSSFFSQSSIISNWPLIQFLSFCICAVWTCRANYFLVHSRVLWNLQLWITSTSWSSFRKDRETSSSIDLCQYPAPLPVVYILIPCPTKFPSTNQSFSEKEAGIEFQNGEGTERGLWKCLSYPHGYLTSYPPHLLIR